MYKNFEKNFFIPKPKINKNCSNKNIDKNIMFIFSKLFKIFSDFELL